MSKLQDENELTKSLVYWVSRRGSNSFWATVINGTDKVFANDEGTMSVHLSPNFRYVLTCHMPFFEKCSPAMRLLVLVHESAHIVHNHIPRLFKMLSSCTDPLVRAAIMAVFGWAADFAANDSIVRNEPGFKEAHKAFMYVDADGAPVKAPDEGEMAKLPGEWPFLLPEEYGFKQGLSMEQYFVCMLKDLNKFKQRAERMLADMEAAEGKGGESGEPGEGEEGEGGQPGGPGAGKGGGRKDIVKSSYGKGNTGLPDTIPGMPESLVERAINDAATFQMLQKLHDKITGKAHKQWSDIAKKMTPEEAISAGNKLKKHAQSLVRSANECVSRDRGFLPGGAQRIIDELMTPEQIPWDAFLKDIIQGAISARVDEAMTAPNLALINEEYIEPWPGQTLEFGFNITWFCDTSGSMGDDEYARACSCLNSLLAVNKSIYVTYVEGDAAIQKEARVTNVEPPDDAYLAELRKRRGYGGTVYTPVFKRIVGADEPSDWVEGAPRLEEKHPKPDLIVVCTDGGVNLMGECFPKYHPGCPIIWIMMPNCSPVEGMSDVAPDRIVQTYSMKEET